MEFPIRIKSVGSWVVLSYLLFVYCSKPSEAPLRWQSKIELPITNEKFYLGEELAEGGIVKLGDSLSIIGNVPKALTNDTIAFSVHATDSISFERKEDTLKTQTYTRKMGPISLNAIPRTSAAIPCPVVGGVTAGRVIADTIPLVLEGVKSITFHNKSTPLQITVTNNFATTDFRRFIIGITNSSGIALKDTIKTTLSRRTSAVASINVDGEKIDTTSKLFFLAEVANNTTVSANDTVKLSLSFDGLYAQRALIHDGYANFSDTIFHNYEITDTIDIHYIDLESAHFLYVVNNQTNLKLKIDGEHTNMWQRPFCRSRNIQRAEQLSNFSKADSQLRYMGWLNTSANPGYSEPRTNATVFRTNLSDVRLFPIWHSTENLSVTPVKYIVSTSPKNQYIEISETDSIDFTIVSSTFSFERLYGTVMIDFERISDTKYVAIKFPWDVENKKQLRGKMLFRRVMGELKTAIKFPEGAFIEKYIADFTLLEKAHPESTVFARFEYDSITNGDTLKASIAIQKIVNLFPDTVAMVLKTTIPKNTELITINDKKVYFESVGGMTVYGDLDIRMNAYFNWLFLDDARLDLGVDTFTVAKWTNFFRKLESREAGFFMTMENHTNINLTLYCIMACGRLWKTLGGLSIDSVTKLCSRSGMPDGYINMLGPAGVTIPPRDSTKYNSIILRDDQLDNLLYADTATMRWQVVFHRCPEDALVDSNYIFIRSKARLSGLNNMDSLFLNWD